MAREEADYDVFVRKMVQANHHERVGGRNLRMVDLLTPQQMRRLRRQRAQERAEQLTHAQDRTLQQRLRRSDAATYSGERRMMDELSESGDELVGGEDVEQVEEEGDQGHQAAAAAPVGLNQVQLDALLVDAHPLPRQEGTNSDELCLICAENLHIRPTVVMVCNHYCCGECAMRIFQHRTTCPWCMRNVTEEY